MSVSPQPPQGRREAAVEERIDVRRYLEAVRRSMRLIALMVLVITGVVLAISLSLPKSYQSTAKIVFEETTSALGSSDAESTQRKLATTDQLLTSSRVLDAAEKQLGRPLGTVESSVDPSANIINVIGKSERAADAAATANAVSDAFLRERAELDRARLAAARETIQREIDQLGSRPDTGTQISALRQRLSELGIAEATVGADLQIAERAEAPDAATSPRPLRNAILALFASIFLGILVALARDQLVPRLGSTRELSRILELPVLIGVPFVRRGLRARRARILGGIEDEAYQTLRATLEFSAGNDDERIVLVTGALHGEGKTTATARLGRALARAGHKTLIVSADLRVPKLHEKFGLPLDVGLADILAVLDWENQSGIAPDLLERATNVVVAPPRGKRSSGYLHVITSGTKAKDPGRLISGHAMRAFLEEVRRMDYDYVLVDAPPLLGLADSQVLSQWADTMLIVSRLDRITVEAAGELREVLDRLETRPQGLIVIGVTGEISPYYLTRRPTAVGGESEAPA